MKPMDWLFALIEATAWYSFLFYFIYSIKMPVNLFYSSFILLVLLYIATIACPWLRHTNAWKKMWK